MLREFPDESLIDRIYEAAIVPGVWQEVLVILAKITATRGSVLLARSSDSVQIVASDDRFQRDATEYFTVFSAHNERLIRLLRLAKDRFVGDSDVYSREEIARDPMFQDFLIPRGYGRGLATVIPMATGEEIILHCEGSFSPDPFDQDLFAFLNRIRPHLARAAFLSSQTAFLAAKTAIETLEMIGLPAMALDERCRIVISNSALEAEAQEWMMAVGGRMALRDLRADRLFREAVRQVRSTNVVRSIPVARANGPGVIHILPVRRSAIDLFGGIAALAVCISPKPGKPLSAPLLQSLFDLTPAEVEIASLIASGRTAPEIATNRQTSPETVKGQVKQIMAKTGCRRQAELQVMLRTLCQSPPA